MNEGVSKSTTVSDKEISIAKIFGLILKNLHWVLISGISAALIVLVIVTIFITPKYESTATFYVYNSSDGSSSNGSINNNDLQAAESLASTYSKIFKSNTVLDSVLKDINNTQNLTRKDLTKMVTISLISNTQLLEITVTSPDPKFACEVTRSFIKIAPDEIVRITKAGGVEVVDPPEIADEKTSPRVGFDVAIGFVIGLFLSVIVILLKELSDTTIYLPEDLDGLDGAIVLGQIPSISGTGNYNYWTLKKGGIIRYEGN